MRKKRRNIAGRSNSHADETQSIRKMGEDELFELLDSKDEFFFLVLDQVQDPHNLGAILRTCDGVAVDGVITPQDKSVPVTDTVRRIACGGAERIPVFRVGNLARILDSLKEKGVRLVGTADGTKKLIYNVDLTGSLGIVMGAESEGIRRLTRERCDEVVRIPMKGDVDCLNVSVATGVCLFESVRQRSHF